MKKRVFIIGGYKKTKFLATSLIEKGYLVGAVNPVYAICHSLATVEKLKVFHGDPTKPYVLEEANIFHADLVIVMTEDDADNLIIAQLCKKKFNVKKTVSVISDPKKTAFFRNMGVDSVVCATGIVADVIKHHAIVDKMETLIPIGHGDVRIVQLTVHPDSPAVGNMIKNLNLPNEVVISCILRNTQSMVPFGDTKICAGDELIITLSNLHEQAVLAEFTGREDV